MTDYLREVAEGFADCALVLIFGAVLFLKTLANATVTSQLTSCELPLSHFFETRLKPSEKTVSSTK
jgi:hypothetical protein